MHMRTDHEECVTMMFCETCIVTTSISTFSPNYPDLLRTFATAHAPCDVSGEPDFAETNETLAPLMETARAEGLARLHEMVRVA